MDRHISVGIGVVVFLAAKAILGEGRANTIISFVIGMAVALILVFI